MEKNIIIPNRIIIATKNLDKFKITSELLSKFGLKGQYFNLNNFKIENSKEYGNTIERAKQKAVNCRNYLKSKEKELENTIIVGIDDEIVIEKERKTGEDSKVMTDKILSGDNLKIGDIIKVIRIYYFIFSNGKKTSIKTTVPFVYLNNKKEVKREDSKYPLSKVLGHLGQKKCVSEMTQKETLNYNLFWSKNLQKISKK